MPYRSGCGSVAGAILALMAGTLLVGPASAQTGEPIKIGFSMALTGGLAPNGKSALLAQKLWEEDVNAKGGLLGRPVKLVYYDDKSSPAEVPAIYTKLLDVDKVELVVGPYATAQIAPAMPIVMQKKKTFIGLLGLAVNNGAGREAADGGHRGGGPGVLPQCRRWCPRECQGGEPARGL